MNDAPASPYVPVSCVFHERLEFAVLRRQALRLLIRSGEGETELRVMPLDVATREGAEWLQYRDADGRTAWLRLDALLSAEPV